MKSNYMIKCNNLILQLAKWTIEQNKNWKMILRFFHFIFRAFYSIVYRCAASPILFKCGNIIIYLHSMNNFFMLHLQLENYLDLIYFLSLSGFHFCCTLICAHENCPFLFGDEFRSQHEAQSIANGWFDCQL